MMRVKYFLVFCVLIFELLGMNIAMGYDRNSDDISFRLVFADGSKAIQFSITDNFPLLERKIGNQRENRNDNGHRAVFTISGNVKCFNCNKKGHVARNCHVKKFSPGNNSQSKGNWMKNSRPWNSGNQSTERDKARVKQDRPFRDIECFHCKRKGHIARDCRSKGNDGTKPGNGTALSSAQASRQ